MMGMESGSNLKICGESQSSGSLSFTESSLSRTSFVADSRFVPHSNSSLIEDVPSYEVEDISLMPETLTRAPSRTRVTFCSTSLGPLPE